MNFQTAQDRRNFADSVCDMVTSTIKYTHFSRLTEDPDFINIMEEYFASASASASASVSASASTSASASVGIAVMLIYEDTFAVVPGYWLNPMYNGYNTEMHHPISDKYKKFRVLRKDKRNQLDIQCLINIKHHSKLESLKFHKSASLN